MKRALCLLLTITALAARAQDFAAKFMALCSDSDSITCQTIGPKMMQRLVENLRDANNKETTQPNDSCAQTPEEEQAAEIFAKLRSARILTATTAGDTLYQRAQNLMEKNKNRFQLISSAEPDTRNQVYARKRNNIVRELVMLNLSPDGQLTIICLTGQMDEEFMQTLATANWNVK